MGIFFQEAKRKRSKLMTIKDNVHVILLVTLIILSLVNNFDFGYLKLAFIILGVNAMIDAVESYIYKDPKKVYLIYFGLGISYILLSFQWAI
jgi:hypothetical protein